MPGLIDWNSLMPTEARQSAATGTKCPTVSHEKRPVSHPEWDSLKPDLAMDTTDILPSVPPVPLKNQWTGKEGEIKGDEAGGAAAGPQSFRAEIGEDGKPFYPAHPAAVMLVMAWARFKRIEKDYRASLLLGLEVMPPAEQVKHWHGVCLKDGLKPWHVLCVPASLSGADCTNCRNLSTRHEAIGDGRVQYHWACSLGYLILETGRGTERVWIAPPECKSFERWYPSDWR